MRAKPTKLINGLRYLYMVTPFTGNKPVVDQYKGQMIRLQLEVSETGPEWCILLTAN